MPIFVKLIKLNTGRKKYKAIIKHKDKKRTVWFGARGYEDYTTHKNKERKRRYIARHRARENWDKSGIYTAGFWSKHLLWNKPSISASKRSIARRFNVRFI